MDAQKKRQLQYFKQRHAHIPVNPDTPDFLSRFENADATRRLLLETQRLQFEPTKAVKKAQAKRKRKQRKGRVSLKGELAASKRKQKIFEVGQRRYKETQEPRVFGEGPAPDWANILAAFGGAPAGAGGFHWDPAVEQQRLRLADRERQDNFQLAQDRLRLEGEQLGLNRQIADRERGEGQRRFNIQFAEEQRLNIADTIERNRRFDLEAQRVADEAQQVNRDIDVREENLERLARLNVDQLRFEQERTAAAMEEAQRQFDERAAIERERLARQQGVAGPVDQGEIAGLRERLRIADRDVAAGQGVEQEVRRRADDDRRQADERDAAQRAEMTRLATELELERAREPPPPEVEFRVERVEVPGGGLTAADREFLARGLERVEQSQLGIFEHLEYQDQIQQHLMRTGREGDVSAAQRLEQAAELSDQFHTPLGERPSGEGLPHESVRPPPRRQQSELIRSGVVTPGPGPLELVPVRVPGATLEPQPEPEGEPEGGYTPAEVYEDTTESEEEQEEEVADLGNVEITQPQPPPGPVETPPVPSYPLQSGTEQLTPEEIQRRAQEYRRLSLGEESEPEDEPEAQPEAQPEEEPPAEEEREPAPRALSPEIPPEELFEPVRVDPVKPTTPPPPEPIIIGRPASPPPEGPVRFITEPRRDRDDKPVVLPEVERHEEAQGRVGDLEAELMNLDLELEETSRVVGERVFVGAGEEAGPGQFRRMDDIRADKKGIENRLEQAREREEFYREAAQQASFQQAWEVGGEEFQPRRDVEARRTGLEAGGTVEEVEPAEPSLVPAQTFLDRVVPEYNLSAEDRLEGVGLFDDDFLKEIHVRGVGRARGKGELDPTGFILENPTKHWIMGINPGGQVNIVSRRKGGEVAINTGQGSRGIKRTQEKVLREAIRTGDFKLVRGAARMRPANSVPREKGQGAKKKR